MAREPDDYKTLRALKPLAQTLLDLEGVFDRGLTLKANLAALETRKAALSKEVADLLAKTEAAKQKHEALTRQHFDEVANLVAQRDGEKQGLVADRAARAKAADDDARAYKQRNETLGAELREENDRLRAENKGLRDQRAALQKDLDETLTKYARVR